MLHSICPIVCNYLGGRMWQLPPGRVPITLISVPCSVSVRYSLDQAHCCGSVGGEAWCYTCVVGRLSVVQLIPACATIMRPVIAEDIDRAVADVPVIVKAVLPVGRRLLIALVRWPLQILKTVVSGLEGLTGTNLPLPAHVRDEWIQYMASESE